MKKFCALALSTIIAVAGLATLTACDPSSSDETPTYSETFEGSASKETYTSEDEAVTAYLSEEISGNSAQAELVSYESKGELSTKEQSSLALSDEEKTGLTSIEKIEVTYRETSTSSYAKVLDKTTLSATTVDDDTESSDTYTQTVYILKYESGAFRYFVPAPSNGDTLTKSYFDSVLDPENYLNVTFNFKSAYESVYTYSGESSTYSYDWDAIAKVAGNYLYEYDTMKTISSGTTSDSTYYAYFLLKDGTMSEAYCDDGDWSTYSTSSSDMFGSDYADVTADELTYKMVENVLKNWFGASIDYTYFEKTDTGFALRANKMKEYIASKGELSASELEILDNFNAEYTVFVTDGRINQCTSKISYVTDTTTYSASYTISPTDFGKTEITIPDEVQELLK
jgi:uncharacterized lipoprotein YehR (DUF1307 family)